MGQSGMIHDFCDQLKYSELASDEPFWDAIYRKAFPNMVNHMVCYGSTQSQRLGVDRVIHLSSGRTLYVDEKKRKREYNDILLEYVSISTTGAPGWVEKDLQIDYLAYAFMESRRVYLFDWLMLRRAWLHYKTEWLKKYIRIEADNGTYKTYSIAVPIEIVRSAVKGASIIQLGGNNGHK